MTTSATAPPPCLPRFNILDGTVIGRCMRRHRHQEFIRFLNAVERAVPAVVHAIVDVYVAHKQPEGMARRSCALGARPDSVWTA